MLTPTCKHHIFSNKIRLTVIIIFHSIQMWVLLEKSVKLMHKIIRIVGIIIIEATSIYKDVSNLIEFDLNQTWW